MSREFLLKADHDNYLIIEKGDKNSNQFIPQNELGMVIMFPTDEAKITKIKMFSPFSVSMKTVFTKHFILLP